jgi:hypothetical protein
MERSAKRGSGGGVPASVKDLEINGKDAMEPGAAGPEIGYALARILDEVVCEPDDQKRCRASGR